MRHVAEQAHGQNFAGDLRFTFTVVAATVSRPPVAVIALFTAIERAVAADVGALARNAQIPGTLIVPLAANTRARLP